jgi:hypothetical protein
LRMVGDAKGLVIDGRLDEDFWKDINAGSRGRFREVQTGRSPAFGTTAMAGWFGNSLYLAVRCDDQPGEQPNVTAAKKGDPAIWRGDVVEVLLQTDSHSYYQIAVNPAGAVVDYDRGADKRAWDDWDSLAEVATQIGDGFWTVEIRIPVTDDENDPLHQVIGRKPTESLPWHINICRQRIRDNGTELSALSPTGSSSFHEVMQFAYLHTGKSHQFEADPTVKNFITSLKSAASLPKPSALKALIALADGSADKLTDLQLSEALKQAAAVARNLKEYAQADQLASRIPIDSLKKTAVMQNLLAQRKFAKVIELFGGEDLARWPFWAAGEGHATRGLAYAAVGERAKAEADFQAALQLTSDKQVRRQIGKNLAGKPKP